MGDGTIPPPDINFQPGEYNLADGLLINAVNDEQDTFQNYLDESSIRDDEERQEIDDEVKQQQAQKQAMIFEALQESEEVEEANEEDNLEEEKALSQHEADIQEQLAQKAAARQQRKELSEVDDPEEEFDEIDREENSARALQGNRSITDRGNQEVLAEEKDPLEAAKKAAKAEKDEIAEHIRENDDDLSSQKEAQVNKHKKIEKDAESDKPDVKEAPKEKQQAQKTSVSQSIAANVDTSMMAQKTESTRSQKAQQGVSKTDLQEQFEALAKEIVSEATVLENGDVTKTTILLNMKGSIFDQGEVTVTAYRYRPLEVNLAFKKFSHEATGVMRKNAPNLKKLLNKKSLQVHQLDIIE